MMKAHYKHIHCESNLFYCELQENKKKFNYPWHFHPEYELTFILSGQGVRYVGNNTENFFSDDLVLLGPNLPHTWINFDKKDSAKAIVVYIKNEFVDKTWMSSYELESINKLLKLSEKGIKFDKSIAQNLKSELHKLLNVPPFEKLVTLLSILQYLAHVEQFQILCTQGFANELSPTNNERINKVYKYIQNNFDRKITLKDVADEVCMTEGYFSRFFSKVMKKSFFSFLNEYKINRACKLLIETDKQVFEICYASGFESIPFFYRQFKKFKNCEPKAYRLRYQKMASMG
jgi:AraC-like DNA-binding protein